MANQIVVRGARQVDRFNWVIGFGQVKLGVRHDLCRGPKTLRRIFEFIRASILRSDG